MAWRDITDFCKQVAADLKANEVVTPMIASSTFSLFDSMSAVEVMDVKMDQCSNLNIGTKSMTDLYAVSIPSEMSVDALIPIFVKMITLEISFLQGYSIIESTHNCVLMWPQSWRHLEQNSTLVSRLLLAFAQSNLKTVSRWLSFFTTSEVYEEEDFNPAYHSLIHCDDIDESELLERFSNLIEEVQAISEMKCREALIAILQYRLQLHYTVRSLDQHANAVASLASSALRQKKRGHASGLHGIPLSSSISEHEFPIIASLFDLVATLSPILSSMLSLLNSCPILQASNGPVKEPVTSLTVATVTSTLACETFSAEFAQAQLFFRSELVRLRNISPLRVIHSLSFEQSLEVMQQIVAEIHMLSQLQHSMLIATKTHIAGQLVFSWSYLWTLCQTLADKKWHLITRSLYVSCMLVPHKVHLDLSLIATFLNKGIPDKVVWMEEVHTQWIHTSLTSFAWDCLKTLFTKREKCISVRWPTILQTCGHVVGEAMYVDDSLRSRNILPPESEDGSSSMQKQDAIYFMFPWLTTVSVWLSTTMMDVYLTGLQEVQVLSEPEELDVFFWYRDYLVATQSHALDKLRSQRQQADRLRHELHQQTILSLQTKIKGIQLAKQQRQAQFELQSTMRASHKGAGKSHSNKQKGKANAKEAQDGKEGETSADLDRFLHEMDEQMTLVQQQLATISVAQPALPHSDYLTMTAEEHLFRGCGQLSRGLFRLVIVYKTIGLVSDVHRDYMTKAQFFARRYAALSYIPNPAPLTFSDFISTINQSSEDKRKEKAAAVVDTSGSQVPTLAEEIAEETTRIADPTSVLQGAILCFQQARKHFDDARKAPAELTETHATMVALSQAGQKGNGSEKDIAYTVSNQAVMLMKTSLASVLATTKILQEVLMASKTQAPATDKAPQSLSMNVSYHPSFPVLEISSIIPIVK